MKKIEWVVNDLPKTGDTKLSIMSLENVERARRFHMSFPQYSMTPLAKLDELAKNLGVSSVAVKDESYRFGLNAFKVLGGSFAMARYIADRIGKDISEIDYEYFTGGEVKAKLGRVTFFTATDGNHGRGVAWSANKLGQKSVVFMPKGSSPTRYGNIKKEGAAVTIEECNYDECVRMADAAASQTENGVVIQDTAWAGYEDIPSWIMQGYGTMAAEAQEQLQEKPTHIFIQAGVGSLASAVTGYFANKYPDSPPKVMVIEADEAACLYRSAKKGDGSVVIADGDMPTIMAGLACGEPNIIGWDILKNHAGVFVSCPDWVAAYGMRVLGAPLSGDRRVISGESGAVSMGLLTALLRDGMYPELKEAIGLDKDSRILMFSTEGDTDPQSYLDIVWNGFEPLSSL